MNNPTKTSVAVLMLILTAVSSVASVNQPVSVLPGPDRAPALAAPTRVAKPVGLNQAEFAKYQTLAGQSQYLAAQQAAGASTTTKVVVGALCVVFLVVAVGVSSGMGGPLVPKPAP